MPVATFRSSIDGPCATLTVAGELDMATRDDLARELGRLEARAVDVIRLDATDVSFVDCGCLGVLHRSSRRLSNRGRRFQLVAASCCFLRVARLAGFSELASVTPTVPATRRSAS